MPPNIEARMERIDSLFFTGFLMGSDDGREELVFDGKEEDDIEALEVKQSLIGELAANMRVASILDAIFVVT